MTDHMAEWETFSTIVTRWAEIMEERVNDRQLKASCCVLASKVLLVSFHEHGIDAWVEPTYAIASNRASWAWQGRPISEWPEEAWSVGIRPGDRIDTGSYPGHLVVMVRLFKDRSLYIVDGSAGQFSRPAKQMVIPSTMVVPADAWPDKVETGNNMWKMSYVPASLGQLHRVGPDWTRNWREYMPAMRKVTV